MKGGKIFLEGGKFLGGWENFLGGWENFLGEWEISWRVENFLEGGKIFLEVGKIFLEGEKFLGCPKIDELMQSRVFLYCTARKIIVYMKMNIVILVTEIIFVMIAGKV